MKNFNEIRMTPELMAKIEECKTVEELVKLAADNGAKLSLADAEKYFTKIPAMKLSDEQLDNVAGGAICKSW